MKPSEVLMHFDQFINKRNLSFEAVIIGGAALSVLGIISRQTRDCDVLHPIIPNNILKASKQFAKLYNLDSNWLNNGPKDLVKDLPKNWIDRTQVIFQGQALRIRTLGRIDLLRTKLYAYCDRGFDLADCLQLNPTKSELYVIKKWIKSLDTNQNWPSHVDNAFNQLAKRLNHEL